MRAADVRFLASGIILLAVAMGVGRFAYTPLLPVMEHDAGLSVAGAGTLAFANLLSRRRGARPASAYAPQTAGDHTLEHRRGRRHHRVDGGRRAVVAAVAFPHRRRERVRLDLLVEHRA
jgi:hypothetical protein